MTSLLATYRKVRRKLATPGKSGSGADDVDSSPVTEVGLEVPEIQNEESRSSNEENLHVGNSQEESNVAQTEEDMTTPPPTKSKKVFVSPKLKTVLKRAGDEDPRIGQAYTALQSALNRKKDEFDAYGEYIANVL
ncbi:hypothetical protein QE152_g40053 [Popillia japonica]|uniref:Uncharacterized protein n=1 Tax=Popillia japonica TaxID=7064 RepID=A0AAW1HSJ5_POPJA